MRRQAVILISAIVIFWFLYAFSEQTTTLSDGSVIAADPLFVYKTATYPASVSVIPPNSTQSLGISVDYGKLEYGILPKGSVATKYINLTNHGDEIKIKISVKGNIRELITIGKNNFILRNSEKVPIKLDTKRQGNYSGYVEVTAIKPKMWISKWLISWI